MVQWLALVRASKLLTSHSPNPRRWKFRATLSSGFSTIGKSWHAYIAGWWFQLLPILYPALNYDNCFNVCVYIHLQMDGLKLPASYHPYVVHLYPSGACSPSRHMQRSTFPGQRFPPCRSRLPAHTPMRRPAKIIRGIWDGMVMYEVKWCPNNMYNIFGFSTPFTQIIRSPRHSTGQHN